MKKAILPILILLGVTVWGLWPEPVPVGAALDLQKLKNDIQTLENNCKASTGTECQYVVTGTDYKAIVDVYDGPKGKGYVVNLRQRVNNTIVLSTFNYGPETDRELTQTVVCTDFISATSTNNICEL